MVCSRVSARFVYSHFPLASASSQEIPGERKNKNKQTYKKNITQNKYFRGSFHSRNHATLQRGDISNCSWDQAHPSSPGQSTCSRLSTSNANSPGFTAVWFSCSCTYFSERATSSPAPHPGDNSVRLHPAFGVGFQAKGMEQEFSALHHARISRGNFHKVLPS